MPRRSRQTAARSRRLAAAIAGRQRPRARARSPPCWRSTCPDEAKNQAHADGRNRRGHARHRPDLQLTADPVEFRGYQYHTGHLHDAVRPRAAGRTRPRRTVSMRRYRARDRHHAVSGHDRPRRPAAAAAPAHLPAVRHACRRPPQHAGRKIMPRSRGWRRMRRRATRRRGLAAAMCIKTGRSPRYIRIRNDQRNDHRRAMGRRGQGQGGGLARQPRRHRGALPGRA